MRIGTLALAGLAGVCLSAQSGGQSAATPAYPDAYRTWVHTPWQAARDRQAPR